MYKTEMYVELGYWALTFNTDRAGRRYGKPHKKWVTTGGRWTGPVGKFETEADALEAIEAYKERAASRKPVEYRVRL